MPPAKRSSPGRALVLVLIVLAALYGGMVLSGRNTPALGLDLRGGTTVTLAPKAVQGTKVTKSALNTAVNIMRERVNSLGVGNAEVATEGNNIVISVPGKNKQDALDKIGETALLSIRQVYESNDPSMAGATTADPAASQSQQPLPSLVPTTGSPSPSASGATTTTSPSAASTTTSPSPSASGSAHSLGIPGEAGEAGGAHAQPAGFVRQLPAADSPTPSASAAAPSTAAASASAAPSPSAAATPTASPVAGPLNTDPTNPPTVEKTPTAAELAIYNSLDCSDVKNQKGGQPDKPNAFMVACGNNQGTSPWYRFLLYPTNSSAATNGNGTPVGLIKGSDISSASASLDSQTGTQWTVLLNFKTGAASRWSTFTAKGAAASPQWDTAIVLDGQVMSAEYIADPIPNGQTQISGSFTQKQASQLANVLKYGALPLAFQTQTAETVSATLGNTELQAGLLAGAIGLILVLLYSFFYYRGLSFVTVTSLALSAAIQYPVIVLLGKGINYTLTLAGIAGLIVAVGVTADSFVVFFERLRDEVREGNSLRTAVEKGWVRARRTIVSADFVSLIAAVILYLLAIGDVRGFAFTLGLSTVVDLFIVFFFTKPLITLLGRTKFFGNGHRMSGLDPARLGVTKLPGVGTTITRRPAPARKV